MTPVIISLTIFILYLSTIIFFYGIPPSVSETFYLLENSKKKMGIIFTLFCVTLVGFLIPTWLDNSPEKYQFLAFLACAGLGFVGVASQFKEDFVKKVHFGAAGICAVAALVWMIVMGYWFMPVGIGIITISLTLLGGIKFVKNTLLFWLEVIAFVSLFLTLIIHIFLS